MNAPQDNRLAQGIAYLEASLAPLRVRPELHAHRIAAYERYLTMARSSSTAEEYAARVKADGEMFEVNRALALDRHANSVRIQRTLGDDRLLRAAFGGLRAAREATGHLDLDARLTAAVSQTEPLVRSARVTTGGIRDLFVALLDWALQANPQRKAGHLAVLREVWGRIRAHDPDCTFQKLCTYPPYRRRIPFGDERLSGLGRWFEEALS
jgi:hypothetical protein